MPLKDPEASFQEVPQFGILGGWDKQAFKRMIDLLVVGNLIGDVGPVVGGSMQFCQPGLLPGFLLR